MLGRESSGRPFAVNVDLAPLPLVGMLLHLGDVVRHVVHQVHAHVLRPASEHLLERLADPVHDHLAVGPGIVRPAGHGRVIVLPLPGVHRGAGQLAVRQTQVAVLDRPLHDLQIVSRDLMPAAA
ncbi:hypothetical protein DSECCO2_644990 [anaerobic digester metagenome]